MHNDNLNQISRNIKLAGSLFNITDMLKAIV